MSCSSEKSNKEIEIIGHELFVGTTQIEDDFKLNVNTDEVLQSGIIIPNLNGSNESKFVFTSKFQAESAEKQEYYYKIYYQNKSYKYAEKEDDGSYSLKSAENFYGSWENVSLGFKSLGLIESGQEVLIKDSFRIVGNPRNEERFYGLGNKPVVTSEMIENSKSLIRNNTEWFESIKEKAQKNKIPVEEQLYLDALWQIDFSLSSENAGNQRYEAEFQAVYKNIMDNPEWKAAIIEKAQANGISMEEQAKKDAEWTVNQKGVNKSVNHKFKRNPRMGEYEFMLVIITKQELNALPNSLVYINEKDELYNDYLNPFFYFNSDRISNSNGIAVDNFNETMTARISMQGDQGVYVNPLNIRNPNYSRESYNTRVGDSEDLYKNALYQQYFHVINRDYKLQNVPVSADVIDGSYSREEFYKNKEKYPIENRKVGHTNITNQPGKTVFYNDSMNAIQLVNPGSEDGFKKENVGVMTRVGLTYGKYTAKIRFPKIINNENVWNGLTCAFWLFSEDMNDWNKRDICDEMGYLPKGAKKYSEERFETSTYSEIDIEIVKTSKHWPQSSYGGIDDYPIDTPEDNHNLMVTTTNWDLGCRDPKDFNQGIEEVQYDDKTFQLHRWDYWYQALTSKFEYEHDKTVGKDFYYQIEWKPEEIIWRIGPSKDELDIIGYMTKDNTKIPNNQMIAIVTQEFHYALWWPLAPFDQNNVPFPESNINGFVYSIEVE